LARRKQDGYEQVTATISAAIANKADPSAPERGIAAADVWLGRVDDRRDTHRNLALLDVVERSRADRFGYERDWVRFVNRRAFLRRVLAGYLDMEPEVIRFRTTPGGRPDQDHDPRVSFNASHSCGLAVVAVTHDHEVGVDVEGRRTLPCVLADAEASFSAVEIEELRALPDAQRSPAFLRLWTRKEAVVKASGLGLSMPLDGFTVQHPGEVALVGSDGQIGHTRFALADLDLPAAFLGAVAICGALGDLGISYHELP
jgi:4'-phosphopantetheinyl transferase